MEERRFSPGKISFSGKGGTVVTYEEAMEKVNGRLRFGVKPGLERISSLLERLGNPQKRLKFVHVAGTNGKGTACTLLSSVLRESGLKTGLYTSPYVVDFRERFQVDGEMISQEELIREVELLSPIAEEFEARGETVTEFEFITALAFHWFCAKACDMVVLEVGLGGRFDATNVIDVPEAAVIMSISLDHTAVLGDTLEQIAFEKAGIIKPGGRVALYPEQGAGVTEEIRKICRERGAELTVPCMKDARELEVSLEGTDFQWKGRVFHTPFLGEHQLKNAVTVLAALEILEKRGYPLTVETVERGFEKAFIPARMELLSREPLCLLDGGHNPGCALALKDVLERFVPQRRTAVIGMLSDKDSREALRILGPLFSKIITIAPDNSRALPAEELAETAREFCPDVAAAHTCGEALALSFRDLKPEDALVVCGSFYLCSEIRESLTGKMENIRRR